MKRRFAVVVDPLSTGAEYPAAFAAEGVEVVAVLSENPPCGFALPSWRPENFRHIHTLGSGPDAVARLAGELREYEPEHVIVGSEFGVELADQLIALLAPGTGHREGLTEARRDKWAMARAVAEAGVPGLRQVCATDPAEVARWLGDTGLAGGRFVLKPPRSFATDNVHVVEPGEDWLPLFHEIMGRPNLAGAVNEAVLVQEFADGVEFMLNSYSVDGVHGLTDVCRYTKVRRGDRIGVYDLVDFISPDDPDVAIVWPYAQQVLDALGVRNGPCHTEVVLTAAGPRLLEVGARPAGGGHQMITELATGTNQIRRTVEHRVHGRFDPAYELVRRVCSVVISAPHEGVWRNPEVFADVESLPTFHMRHFYFGADDVVPAPGSMATMVGWVVLASPDHDAVTADYRRIKELEARMVVDPLAERAALAG